MINFDITKYLESKDIKYRTSGKNIGNNWLGVENCPRCGKGGYHCGINLKTGAINCWACGRIKLQEFIQKTSDNCNWRKAKEIQAQFKLDPEFIDTQEEVEYIPVTSYQLPKQFTETFPTEAKDYIKNRGFDFLNLRKKYGILWSGEYGREKFRIAFPIIMDNKIVSYGARTILENNSIMPYMYERDAKAGIHRRELLFGLNHVFSDKAILVEGIFDSVNIGFGTVALLSKWFSTLQILRLKQSGVKKFYLMPDNNDPGSIESFKKLESNLVWADEISYIEYDSEDPGSLEDPDVKLIRRMVF